MPTGFRITKRTVDALPAGATLWDTDVKGFGCRRTLKGVASYVVKYRHVGRQRWYTIGKHGSPWTPETARSEAKAILGAVAKGEDPAAAKAEKRNSETVAEFAARYMSDHAKKHKKPRSVEEDRKLLRGRILPAFGTTRIESLSRRDVAKLHASMATTPYLANRVLALVAHMYTIAEKWGAVPDGYNPTRHIDKYKEKPRERFLSPQELTQLGETLATAKAEGENPYVIAALRLLILTGARLNEILTLQWAWVDLENRILHLPDSKTGSKDVHLNAPAVAVLSDLPRQAGNPHVICGAKQGAHLINLQKPWQRIRTAAGLEDVRIHDLRHSFASIAVARGMSLPMIGALLGHSQPQTTQRYAHLAADPLKTASDSVATEISALMNGGGGKVVPLKSKNG